MRFLLVLLLATLSAHVLHAQTLTGAAAMGDWRADAPGVIRRITPADLPPPGQGSSAPARVVAAPPDAALRVPPGFRVEKFAGGLRNPRLIRTAPNGDIFIAETSAGRLRVLRAADGAATPARSEIFADGLDRPFGISFYPPGPQARFVYVATNNAVQRFPYAAGDLQARAPAQVVVPALSATYRHHSTRDVAFSPDGGRMFVSIGSGSNDAEGMPALSPAEAAAHDAAFGLGAAWGEEEQRADVLVFDPEGGGRTVYATGIRNCVSLAFAPAGGDPFCATNERDGLGDNLPPDYVTRVQQGQFFGWPWYYIGAHPDPNRPGQRPELASRVSLPDVLIQPHSAPLGMTFYTGTAFPPDYRGDAFVALHGSWNRGKRTGYKVVRLHMQNGVPDGTYADFLTGFVTGDDVVWGRPVGVAVAHDGALLVTEDGNGTVWRITYTK